MEFIRADYFSYHPREIFDGIITDIPYKGCFKQNSMGEHDFEFSIFLEKTDKETYNDAFLITFCNFLCAIDLFNASKKTNWRYHCYAIWIKTNVNSWISWNMPLRSVEFILFFIKGNFGLSFKTGQRTLPYHRSSFGNAIHKSEPKELEFSEQMYSELFYIKSPKAENHPAEKPMEFSSIFAKIVGKKKKVLDPFCGSGNLLKAFQNSIGIDNQVKNIIRN